MLANEKTTQIWDLPYREGDLSEDNDTEEEEEDAAASALKMCEFKQIDEYIETGDSSPDEESDQDDKFEGGNKDEEIKG